MRELTDSELLLISGGFDWDNEDIVVTGSPYPPFYSPPYFYPSPGGPFNPSPPPPYGGGYTPSYPAGFDQALDNQADALAAQLGAEMAAKDDVDKREYVGIIWKDADGNLHRTTVETDGNTNSAPVDKVWPQVDFANGGKVVAIMHSHPSLFNAGSVESPNWQPAAQSGTLSSTDFDHLINYGSGGTAGFDAANYRSYLFNGGSVKEYYSFQQDATKVGAGGQANWAVTSSDYGI